MKTLLLLLRTKLFLFGFLSICTFILANNYIQRNDLFKFAALNEEVIAKPENFAAEKKKVSAKKTNLQLQENAFREASANFEATVVGDQNDYAPLSTAIFTGAGFAPFENVILKVKNLTKPCNTVSADSSYFPWTVTTDENGAFITPWTVCNCPGDSLRLKATGQTSQSIAYFYFTDAPRINATVTVNPTSNSACIPSTGTTTVSYTVTATRSQNGTVNGTYSVSGLPTGVTGAFSPATFNSNGGSAFPSSTLTLTISNTAAPGSTVFSVKCADGADEGNGSGTIVLNKAPSFTACPSNITVNNAPGVCSAVANYTATATGTPAPTLSYSFTGATTGSGSGTGSGSTFNKGVTNVIITATNTCSSTTCSFTVIVNDTEAPSITCPATQTLNLNPSCTATVPNYTSLATSTDNCGGALIITQVSPAIGSSVSGVGSFNVTLKATDASNNTNQCTFSVNKVDITAPIVPVITTATGECSVTVTAPTASDNCVGSVTGTTADPLAYSTQGTFTIHWSFNDGNGNISTANQTVIVDDVTAPVVPVITTATGECSVTVTAPTASDNCVGSVTGTTADPLAYSTQGTFTIHWSFNDGNGNISTANQTVIVDDVTAPVVPVITTATGECSVTVTAPTASDNCVGPVTGTTVDPLTYSSQGTFTIHWSFNDGNGNISTANQTVIVDDVTAPAVPVITTATGECSVTVTAPTASDNCVGSVTGTTGDPLTYSSQGTFTIHWSFNDGNGNISTANQTVIVDDVTAPVVPVITTATGECSVTVTAPTASDNCVGSVTGTTADPLTYSSQGTFTIHWSFNDGNGNISTANQTVIVDDITAPAVPVITTATGECSVTVTAPTASDNCVGSVTGTTADPLTYNTQGTFTIHWSFNDGNGNISTANQTVIVDDVTAPVVPVITTATGECSVTVTAPTASDNCVGSVTGTTGDPLTYSSQGTFTIHWSFNDGNGNISTANQTVIVDDVTAPVVPVITTATGECSVTVTAPTATDNCVGSVTGTTADPLTYSAQGTFTIHWSFDDGNGNISTANQTVIVDDVTAPVAPVITTATGECSVTVTAPTASDNCVGSVTGTTADPLTYSTQGTFTIHWSFNDGNGNISTANQTVIVDDMTAPVVPAITTATGECSVTVTAPTASDNCVGSVTGTTTDPLTYSSQGTFTIHWSFNDGNGNISTANQTVIVDDITAPVVPVITTATGECSVTVTAPTASDNCVGSVTGTTADPLTYSSQGTFTIHWSFNDGNGNISTANQTVIVDDITAPVVPVITTATGECSVTVTAPTASDNCVGSVTGTTADPLTYSSQGTFTIHWSFNDGNGNISTANQTVIVDDVTAPVVPVITTATGECSVTVTAPTASDNCVGSVTGTTSDPLTYSSQGTFIIHWSFNDGNGNISTANQTVIVDDITAPVVPVITTATGECSVTVTAPTASDNCVGSVTGTTADPLTYSTQGTFTVHWSFNDGNGNISTANQTVIVDDVTAPVVPVITTATGECSVTVTAPTASDNCVGSVTGTTADPLTYNTQGTFTIHWSFNDGNGNISTANQTVIVDDVTAPAVPVITTATGECSVTVTAPTASDNCVGSVTGTTADPLTYSTQGTFTVHWSFNDGNGNISTANQTVIVDDITAPVVPVITTATGECSVTVTAPTASDNCVGSVTGTTADPLTYSTQGTFTVHWSFNDGNGNISTANQTVIVDDVTAPAVPVITTATGECSVTVTAPTASDNCVGPVTGTTADPLTYSTQGTFTIHWSFNDGNGNISTANQTVIVDDVTAPVVPVITIATGECSVTVSAPTASDNCVGSVTGTTGDPLTYSSQGTFTIHWSFDDGNGNISTANQTVIVDDVTAPIVPVITTATGECSVTVTAPTASDNCVGSVTGTTADPLTYSTQGTFTIHWSFNDGNGNISTANQTVIVDDVTAPVAPVITTATGECSVTVTAPTASDNCVGSVTGTTSDPLTYNTQGTFTIHWSFNDGNGNISTANQTVIVNDVTAPVVPVITTATGECSVTVTAPTASDNCVGSVTGTTSDALTYNTQGTFTIHWSFNDGNGNISTANQAVIVDDITAPVVPVITTATGECSVTVTAPTASDNCVGSVTGTTSDPLTYSSQGTFTIHWSFNDGNGNISTANQTVIVDDVTAPVVPVITTATGECSVTVSAPTASDNCVGSVTGTTADPLTYSSQGTFTIHWSFNDGNGNTSTANQTVIVDDVTAPAVPVITTATGECSVTVTAPTASDNCVGSVTGTTNDPLTYSSQGTFTIHWSFNDGNGNISTANQTIIVADVTAPSISCIAPISVNNTTGTCAAVVNYAAPVGTDNCSGSVTVQTTGLSSGSAFPVGVTINTFKVTDAGGNTATCSFTVTVNDTQNPTISCPANITLSACTSTATWSTPSGNDNCPGVVVTQTAGPSSGSTFANGSTTVIAYKATDAAGNTATCSFTVTRIATLTTACTNSNPVMYFGYSGDQSSTIKVSPSGGVAPYTVSITMNRAMACNVINNSGDETWSGVGGTSINNNCPSSGSGLTPVSTGTAIPAGGFYSVNISLMQDAIITATITDANGCITTCSTTVHAEDARCFNGNSGVAKVTICHKTGSATNPCVKICVDESAVASHLAHGDFLGNCTPTCMPPVYTTGLGTVSNGFIGEATSATRLFDVKAYPNPTENQFTVLVEGAGNEKLQLVVYDAVGRIVKRIERADAPNTIKFGEDLKVGVYIVEVKQGENRRTLKLIKQ